MAQVIDIFSRARERLQNVIDANEAVEIEFEPKLTGLEILRKCVDEVGPRGVYHELIGK
jgi:hypothetical protein